MISGVVALSERSTFRSVLSDPREPGAWLLFVLPHVARAIVEGDEVDVSHSLELADFDADGPDTPLVVWRWYVLPPPPTPPPASTAEASGVALVDTPHVSFFHYQWLAAAPSDRTLPPGFSLAPAIGHAAFDGPTSATFDVTFNIPEPAPDAPKGDISASGSIDCQVD